MGIKDVSNPFDQFDSGGGSMPPSKNPFDQFDAGPPKKEHRLLGDVGAAADVVTGLPGFAAGVVRGTEEYTDKLRGRADTGKPLSQMKGNDPLFKQVAPAGRREAAQAGLAKMEAVSSATPTTGLVRKMMDHLGYGKDYDESTVNTVMQQVQPFLEKGGAWVEEKTGGKILKEEAEGLANIGMLVGPSVLPRFFKGAKIPEGELKAGKVSQGTAKSLLDQYAKEGGDTSNITPKRMEDLADADISARIEAADLIKKKVSVKEVEELRKSNPLVAQKLDEIYGHFKNPPPTKFPQGSSDPTVPIIDEPKGKTLPHTDTLPMEEGVPNRFTKTAKDIEASLPPVKEGFTRLWRGNRPGEVGANPQFTNSLSGIALPFKEAYKGDLSFIDVPKEVSAKSLNKGVAAEGAEFILPAEYASKAKVVQLNSKQPIVGTPHADRGLPQDAASQHVVETMRARGVPEGAVRSFMGGKADPKLLASLGVVGGGAALGAYLDNDKLEGAIAGGALGAVGVLAPKVASNITDKWSTTLKRGVSTAAVTGVMVELDKDHPVEGALIGLAYGARGFAPRAKVHEIANGMSIDDIANMRNGNIASSAREISNLRRGVEELVPDAGRRAEVAKALDKGDLTGLNPQELKAAYVYRGFTKKYGEAAQDAGVLGDFVENYVTHVVEKTREPPTKVQEVMEALGFNQGGTSPASTKSGFAKSRKYATFDELQKALEGSGLQIKTQDLGELIEIYGKSMNRAVENKRYVDALKSGKEGGEGGVPFVMPTDKAPPSYVHVRSPQLNGMAVHPEIAPAVKFVMEGKNPNAVTQGLLGIAMAQKRLATSASLFHANNLMNAYMGATGRGPINAVQSINAALKVYKEGGMGDQVDTLLKNGLKIEQGRPEEFDSHAMEKVGELADHVVEKATGMKTPMGKMLGGVEKIQAQTFDRLTWNYLHTGMKLAVGMKEMERLQLKHPDMPKDEIARQVSSYVNDTFGGLDWYRVATEADSAWGRKASMALLSPSGRTAMQIGMFAPDWTFSTFRSLYKALPYSDKMPLTRSLHQRYLVRSAVLYATLMNGINIQTSGHPIWENKDDKGNPDPLRIHYSDGTTQQIAKHAMEGPEWLLQPRKTALNKLSPMVKEPIEQLENKEYLTSSGRAPPIAGSRLGHAARNLSPIPFSGSNVPGRTTGESVKRGALGALGAPIYGMTPEEKQAAKEERKKKRKPYP